MSGNSNVPRTRIIGQGGRRDWDASDLAVLLSGGADSAACLAFYLEMGRNPCALFVDYEQRSVAEEHEAALAVAEHYGIPLKLTTWRGPRDRTIGYVQGRNAFLALAAFLELPASATAVALGLHSGTGYPDCSHYFINAVDAVYHTYTPRVSVIAPFLDWSKADIWAYAKSRQVPLNLTYSCERGGLPPCMACDSCLDRKALE